MVGGQGLSFQAHKRTVLGVKTNQAPDYEANISANLGQILQQKRNLNPHRIAQAMTARDVPIDAKGISRIVNGQRRVKFNEAIELARVLGVGLPALTTNPRFAALEELHKAIDEREQANAELIAAARRRDAADEAVKGYVDKHGIDPALVETYVNEWAAHGGRSAFSHAYLMHELTGEAVWLARAREYMAEPEAGDE